MRKAERTEKKRKNRKLITILLTVIFLVSVSYLVFYFYDAGKNKGLHDGSGDDVDVVMEEIVKVKGPFIEKVLELKQENSDVVGWIKIEGMNINYPLLQGTDNDYYLGHNYKHEKSSYGSIYLNTNSNIKDMNSNVIIYGHSMKDRQMFGSLKDYKSKEFYDQHSTIYVATDEEEAEYQIMYVFVSRIFYTDETDVFRYYQYYGFEDEAKYNEYLENSKAIELYNTGVTAQYGDQLLTLITCDSVQDNARLVVVAKKK